MYEDSNYYYCLTNNHVVYNSLRYSKYTVEDCYGNEYNGTLIKNLNTYDLALLRFPKIPDIDIKVIKLAEDNLSIYEGIISMGTPHSLTNTVTYGNILSISYTFTPPADSIELSNVTFKVYTHTAPIYNGSSGGALLDTNMNLVGINFASSVNADTNKFNFAYTVPLANVKEFLALAGINL